MASFPLRVSELSFAMESELESWNWRSPPLQPHIRGLHCWLNLQEPRIIRINLSIISKRLTIYMKNLVYVFPALSVEGKGYCRCWLTGFIISTVDFRDNESAFAMDILDSDLCCIHSFVSRVPLQNFYQEHFRSPIRTQMKAFYRSCDTWGHPISNDSGGLSWWIHTEESDSDIILYLAPTTLEFHSVLHVFHGSY